MTCLSRKIKFMMLHKIANKPLRYLLGIALLAWCIPLRAQWSGSVDLLGGFGGLQGSIANDYAPHVSRIVARRVPSELQDRLFQLEYLDKWEMGTEHHRPNPF